MGPLNPVLKFLHQQEGIPVWDRDFVDPSVVDAQAETASVWLRYKEDWRSGTAG